MIQTGPFKEPHLAYFVSDVVDNLDLTAMDAVYGSEKRGQPPYAPQTMTKILVAAALDLRAAPEARLPLRGMRVPPQTHGKEKARVRPPFPVYNNLATVLEVKGSLRRFAPLTAPGRREETAPGYQGKGALVRRAHSCP